MRRAPRAYACSGLTDDADPGVDRRIGGNTVNTLRARRAAATILLAAGTVLMVPAPAHANCMTDDKGNQVCGDSGTGPAPGQPGSYNGVSGVNNGTVGDIGPDGRPMTGATQPAWQAPGYTPPPAPAPPAATSVAVPKYDTAPPAGPVFQAPADTGTKYSDYVPGSEQAPSAAEPGTGEPAAGTPETPDATVPAATASAEATSEANAPTMTARPTRETAETSEASAEAGPSVRQASATERFNPVPLLFGLGGLLIAGAVIFFVPGIRTAVTGFFNRGSH
jgi:hypothetical protein